MSIKLKGCKWPVADELVGLNDDCSASLQELLGIYLRIDSSVRSTYHTDLGDQLRAAQNIMAPLPWIPQRLLTTWMLGYPQIKVFTDHSPEEMREHGWQLAGKPKHGQWAWIKQFPFQWGLWEMGIV